MFFAFFHKKQRCRLKLDDSVIRKKAGGRRRTEAFTHAGAFTQKSLHKGAFYIQKVLHRAVFTLRSFCRQTSRSFCTQKFLHEEVFTQRVFYTQTRLHTEAFTQRSLYTEERLHTKAFTHTHRGFYTEKPLHRGAFYTQKVLHRVVFPQRSFCTQTSWSFYTQKLLHKEVFTALTHRHRNSYTEKPLRREWLHTEAFTHREIFTQTRFHTEKLLHKEVFTQRNFYTRKLLHTKAFTQRSLCTAAPLREVTSWNWQQFVRKNFRRSFRELTCSQKKRLFPTNMFQKTKGIYFWSRSSFNSFQAHTAMKWKTE